MNADAHALDVRAAIAKRALDPLYLILGDDEAEMARLAADIAGVVEDELRAFNVERIYAGEKGATAAAIVEAARQLPMMGDRRVVVVLRAERLLKPKRRGKGAEVPADEGEERGAERPRCPDRLRREAGIVDDARARGGRHRQDAQGRQGDPQARDGGRVLGPEAGEGRARRGSPRKRRGVAEQMVKKAVAEAGQLIEPPAARLVADRAGFDIVRLRGDIERLMLYTVGKPQITLADVQEVVSAESSQDDWAVTNAIQNGNAAEALRQLALALDAGGVSYQILGQLAWFVRDKMADTRRIPGAIEALFRTDLDLKSSGGDPRVLLERLVVELCGPPSPEAPAARPPLRGRCGALRHPLGQARLVARGGVAVDDLLAGHLVDERDRVAQRVLDLRGIARVDGGADGAERAAEARPILPVGLALDQVLTVRFDCGFVASHKLLILA